MITLSDISLPDDLQWADEFGWAGFAQTTEYAASGALVVQHGQKLGGRPITLTTGESWTDRATVKALQELADSGPGPYLLSHFGAEYNVLFDYQKGPVQSTEVYRVVEPEESHPYQLTIYLIEAPQ